MPYHICMNNETYTGFGCEVKESGKIGREITCPVCGRVNQIGAEFQSGVEHVGSGDYPYRNEDANFKCLSCLSEITYSLSELRGAVEATVSCVPKGVESEPVQDCNSNRVILVVCL